PIAYVWYVFCPTGLPNSPQCVAASDTRIPGSGTNAVSVPGPGDWDVSIFLQDSAGNNDRATAVQVQHLRFDPTPPMVSIAPSDPSNPTAIHVVASDDISGLAQEEVDVQRQGESVWHSLPITPVADGFVGTLDDSQLPDGTYTIRAHAVDEAGNERTTETT